MPIKTAVVNLGEGMIYKITVPDPETPYIIEVVGHDPDGNEVSVNVAFGGNE